jgi:hypothetical protein
MTPWKRGKEYVSNQMFARASSLASAGLFLDHSSVGAQSAVMVAIVCVPVMRPERSE